MISAPLIPCTARTIISCVVDFDNYALLRFEVEIEGSLCDTSDLHDVGNRGTFVTLFSENVAATERICYLRSASESVRSATAMLFVPQTFRRSQKGNLFVNCPD